MNKATAAAAVALVTLLAGCGGGGGGDDGSLDGPNPAQGFYVGGAASNSRAAYSVSLSNGDTWVFYSSTSNDALIAGFARASMDAANGSFDLSSGRDYNLEGLGVSSFTGDGTYVAQDSISGTARFGGGTNLTFNGSYDDSYEDTPAIADVQGSYAIDVSTPEFSDSGHMTVASNGSIDGSSDLYDCDFSGQLTPRTDGNVFDARITFAGGECAAPGETVRGIAFYNPSTDQLLGGLVLGDRSSGGVFAANKL